MSRISVGSRLTGCAKGSSIVEFYPGEIQTSGTFEADPKTAGSTTLLLQVSLPCFLLTAPDTTGAVNTLDLRGGTNATSAPPIDFVSNIFFPFISKYFELHPTVDIRTRGYYPRGGGEIFVSVPAIVGPIKPLELVDRGDVTQIYGRAYVAGSLPVHLINKMVDAAKAKLVEAGYSKSQIAIEKVREPSDGAVGNGSGIFVWAETAGGCILSGGSIGERGRDAGEVGRAGAEELISNLAHNGCVDEHLQVRGKSLAWWHACPFLGFYRIKLLLSWHSPKVNQKYRVALFLYIQSRCGVHL